ncbi:hypothetical protein PIB30_098813, partial [Stylosanthes scabra]|nr:hypothetical protein [Stylosanthes scabra]
MSAPSKTSSSSQLLLSSSQFRTLAALSPTLATIIVLSPSSSSNTEPTNATTLLHPSTSSPRNTPTPTLLPQINPSLLKKLKQTYNLKPHVQTRVHPRRSYLRRSYLLVIVAASSRRLLPLRRLNQLRCLPRFAAVGRLSQLRRHLPGAA